MKASRPRFCPDLLYDHEFPLAGEKHGNRCRDGRSFHGFEASDYATGAYFERYLTTDYRPVTPRVQELFGDIYIPSPADWEQLRDAVKANGIYHAYRLAIAPTVSISYIQNATSSVMPIVEQIETRTYANSTTYYPMPYLR